MPIEDLDLKKQKSKQAIKHFNALQILPEPTAMPDLMVQPEPLAAPDFMTPERRMAALGRDPDRERALAIGGAKKQDFVNRVETAYYANRGQIPVGFFAQLDPEDLEFFAPNGGLEESGLAEDLMFAGQAAYEALQQQKLFDRAAEGNYKKRLAEYNLVKSDSQDIDTFQANDSRDENVAKQLSLNDRKIEGKEYGEADRQEILDLITGEREETIVHKIEKLIVGDSDATKASALDFVGTGMQGFMGTIGLASSPFTGESGLAMFLGQDAAEELLNYKEHLTPEVLEARQELEQARTGEARAELKKAVTTGMLPAAMWREWQQNNPEIIDEYVQKYGFDFAMTGFFIEFQDYRDIPDIDQQIEDYLEFGVYAPMENMIESVAEYNFQTSNEIIEAFAGYGRTIDAVAANGVAAVTGVISDAEKMQMIRELRFDEFLEEQAITVEQGGQTASGVLGLDGTLSGLFLDFGLGVVLDPTTWLIGPKARAGANAFTTAAKANAATRLPAVRLWIKEFPTMVADMSQATAARAAAPFAEVGLMGEALAAVGRGDHVLPNRTWLGHKLGPAATLTPTSLLDELLDDIQLTQIDNLDPGKVAAAKARLNKAGSYPEPIVLQLDEATGRMSVLKEGDELVDYVAAREMGAKVPVVVKPKASGAVVNGKALSPAEVQARLQVKSQWAHNPDSIEAGVGEILAGGKGTPKAEAAIRMFKDEALPTENLTRVLSGEERATVLENLNKLDDPTGVVVDIDMRSASTLEGGFKGRNPDAVKWKFEFDEATPAMANDLNQFHGGADEAEHLVSGKFRVTGIDDATKTIQLEYISDILPDLPNLEGGVPGQPQGKVMDVPADARRIQIGDEDFIRIDELFTPEKLEIKADFDAIKKVTRELLLRGGNLPVANQTWLAAGLGILARRWAKTGVGGKMTGLLRTFAHSDRIPVGQATGVRRLVDTVEFLAADSPEFANFWMDRIVENERALGVQRIDLARSTERIKALQRIDESLADGVLPDYDPKHLDGVIEPEYLAQIKEFESARNVVRGILRNEVDAFKQQLVEIHGGTDWQALVTEMLDDYNRKYIATNKQWAGLVDRETGMVPWDRIHRGGDPSEGGHARPTISEGLQSKRRAELDADKAELEFIDSRGARLDSEQVVSMFQGAEGAVTDVQLPASLLEIVAATEMGGAAYTQWSKNYLVATLNKDLRLIDQIWKANVLLSPRTMMVMSVDELTSLFHAGGGPYIYRYLQARSDLISARLNSFMDGSIHVGPGTRHLRSDVQKRIQSVESIPLETRMYEAALAEHITQEPVLMKPGDLGYKRAAQAYEQTWLQNPAFRSYLRGREAFRDWFRSPAGQDWQLSQSVVYNHPELGQRARPLKGWEEAYELAHNTYDFMERMALKHGMPADAVGDFREAWRSTAEQIGADPGGGIHVMPEWTSKYYGAIEGYKPVYPGSSQLWPTVGRAFEAGAANPASFRQGLMAEMMRVAETQRLRSLFESQGKKVVSDAEMIEILKRRGVDVGEINPFNSKFLDMHLQRAGIYTDSYVARLAEARAQEFVDQMTYSFETGSRVGDAARPVFPFGRPWGEMFGRWGRMLGSRAIARPWLRRFGLEKAVQKVLDYAPVNPKTAGFLSRVAARDLQTTGGMFGEEQEIDFTPITFLPTSSGGISNLVPGLGLWPIALGDKVIDLLTDPIADPIGYQQVVDSWAQFSPGFGLHGRSFVQRTFGTGLTGVMASLTTEIGRGWLHKTNEGAYQLTGNVKAQLTASRAVSAELADPEFMELLLSEGDEVAVELMIVDALKKADTKAAKLNSFDVAGSWLIPVRGSLDSNLDELYEVWVRAARNSPDLFPYVNIPDDELLQSDKQLLLQTGDTIRSAFHRMTPMQQDLAVAANPTLAVNNIRTWKWSDSAPDNLPGRKITYRTTNSSPDDESLSESLARHNLYVNRGWVVPRDAETRAWEILGTITNAKLSISSTLYTAVAQETNNIIWDTFVSDKTKDNLAFALTDPRIKRLGITDARVLWQRWATERELIEDQILIDAGLEPNTPEGDAALDNLREKFNIPVDEQAWSTSWRGDEVEDFSNRFRDKPIFLNDTSKQIIETLGLDVTELEDGATFLSTLMEYRSNARSGAYYASSEPYAEYNEEQGRATSVAFENLRAVVNDAGLTKSYRSEVKEFLTWLELEEEKLGGITRSFQDEVVDRFSRLATAGRDAGPDWDRIWHYGFQPRFGPRNWTPPEPPSPFLEDGSVSEHAWSPHIRAVVDGDTLVVSENMGPALSDIPYPRFNFGGGGLTIGIDELRLGERPGEARMHKIRLLGVLAADFYADPEAAEAEKVRLEKALLAARENGDRIWLVRDPNYAGGNVDPFGRELAWLWIGDQPFYFPDELSRTN